MPNRLRERDARASTRGFPLRLAHWMKGFAIVLSLSATHAFAQQSPAPADGVYNLLVGTYTGGGSDGIYVYRFDTKTGSVAPVSSAKTVNPSYLLPSRLRHGKYVLDVKVLDRADNAGRMTAPFSVK